MTSEQTIAGLSVSWAIIAVAVIIAGALLVPSLFGPADSGIASAQTCENEDLYEKCRIGGGSRGDCREAYCEGSGEFSSCSWYDVFCRWAG